MPSINILFEGIIALLYERDQTGTPTTCVLGVVQGVPDHKLTIECEKDGTAIPINPQVAEMRVDIDGTTENGIRFFKEALINRVTGEGADRKSFSWILDFENELYEKEIGVDTSRFQTIFRINNCEVFTEKISDNFLLCNTEANPHESPTLVGRVATIIGFRADLDTANSVARLFHDGNQIVEVKQGEKLEMKVSFICEHDDDARGLRPGHANHYYRALGNKLVFGEKQLFSSTKMPPTPVSGPVSPDASCLPGGGGKSNPGGD
ncbi:MAG TPA: hypothetical protein VJR02_18695 [Pyrinomonadaceae bacterium]|nr:hypothetical protein [Pyrinomonadaceae bacterium]